MDLLVKRYPQGKQSTHLHSLRPGDSVMFAVCIPGYKWTPNKHASVTLIAGGAGITPIYQLVQGILDNPEDKTRITLVFGVNSEQDVLLDDELKRYEASHPGQFRAVYAVSGLEGEKGDRYRKGYVTEALLREVAAAPPTDENTKVMVCGPPAMEEALLGKKGWGPGKGGGILEKLGYRKDQIHQF
jgi:cytochrome-b5 reductase